MITHAELVDAAHAFYTALNAFLNGNGAPMQAIWLNDERISTGRPIGTFAVGREAVLGSWVAMASIFDSGHVDISNVKTRILSGTMGYTMSDDHAQLVAMHKPTEFRTRSTNLFSKVGGAVYVVHHHVDVVSELQKAVNG